MKCVFYFIETEKRESDKVHPKLIIGENDKREGERGQAKGGEHYENMGEEIQSKKEFKIS